MSAVNPPGLNVGNPSVRRLLILNNPGRVSRFSLTGLIRAAEELGLALGVCELSDIWQNRGNGAAMAQAARLPGWSPPECPVAPASLPDRVLLLTGSTHEVLITG